MSSITGSEAVLRAVFYIENENNGKIVAKERTIRSFLRGAENSPHIEFFMQHGDICGSYPNISMSAVKELLTALCLDGKIFCNDDGCYKVQSNKVKLNKSSKHRHILFDKFMNKQNAKVYTLDDFESMTDWDDLSLRHRGEQPKHIVEALGRNIFCDSKLELNFVNYVVKYDLVTRVGSQNIYIPCDTAFRKNVNYYPDICILTKDNNICIVEIKPAEQMSNHIVISKYSALKKYCIENGYLYAMVDPKRNYRSFEELKKLKIDSNLLKHFNSWLHSKNNDACFTSDDINKWFLDSKGKVRKNDYLMQVSALVINNNLYNVARCGFEVYKRPIKSNKNN